MVVQGSVTGGELLCGWRRCCEFELSLCLGGVEQVWFTFPVLV